MSAPMTPHEMVADMVRRSGVAMNYRSMGRALVREANRWFGMGPAFEAAGAKAMVNARRAFEAAGAKAMVNARRAFEAADAEMKNPEPA